MNIFGKTLSIFALCLVCASNAFALQSTHDGIADIEEQHTSDSRATRGTTAISITLDTYISDLQICGRKPAYYKIHKTYYYLATVPSANSAISFTFTPLTEGTYTLTLTNENGEQVTNTKDIDFSKQYALVLSDGEQIVARTPISFSSLPVLEISHEGALQSNMTEYLWGKMVLSAPVDAECAELQARFKPRGATAQQYMSKPSLNMKLRELQEDGSEIATDHNLLGLRSASSWILDAMAIDRIQMRNRVCFDIWNEYSRLPYETNFNSRNGTVGRFVEVVINNKYKGIYCLTDRINRKLLNLKKPEVDEVTGKTTIRGAIYKHGTTSILDQNTPGYFLDYSVYVIAWHDAWELSEPQDYASLAAWDGLNTIYNNKRNKTWIKENFYIDQLAQYQILVTALSINDNWGNKNSFISARNIRADGDKHKFVYTPWDLDTSLGGWYNGKYYNGTYNPWTVAEVAASGSMPVPFSILAGDNDFKAELRNAWIQGSVGALSVSSVKSKMEKYRDQFLSSGAWDRQVANPNSAQLCTDLTQEINYIVEWYEARFKEMDTYFGVTDKDRATAISSPAISTFDDSPTTTYYDLQGRIISHNAIPSKSGIYIKRNGKASQKIIVR